ncbi:hypothetical protein [Bacteroides sp.]|uniref:hypothetical protein n=1 Tax=Bacteroides sp. TaxID=29523 RepID=UPI002579AF5E|nr:hypothetical protein [Bacteroides sp.]
MMKLLYRLTTVLLPALLWGALFTSCQDDQYNKIDDLFQPRFVLEKPEVKSNSITLVWYKVNAERKSKVDDNTAKMQSIKWLGV